MTRRHLVMTRRHDVLLSLLGLASVLSAPAIAAAPVPNIPFERYRLPNGLEVLLHVDHRAPLAHVQVWYKVGSKDEVPGKTGFAHLFEHMMFEGTKQIRKGDYFRYLAQAGASAHNAATSTDRTTYFETLPASQLELGLWLESSRMGFLLDRPAFHRTFASQRDVVKNERRQTVEDVPLGGVARVALEALFPVGHPYRHEVVGSMKDLDAASEADLKDFYNRFYAPGNAVLLVAGDFDPATAKNLIGKYFAPITPGPSLPPAPMPALTPLKAEQRLVMEANIDLAYGQMSWNTVPVFTPGDAEMDMLANILGEGTSSRLYRVLVHDLKIAESVSVSHLSRPYGGTFEIDYTPMKGHSISEIEQVIDDELDELRSRGPSRDEVTAARNQIKTDLLQRLESLYGRASRLLYYDAFADDPAYLSQDLERYENATPESLQRWARSLLPDSQRVLIDVEPNPGAPLMGRLVLPHALPADDAIQVVSRTGPGDSPTPLRRTPDAAFRQSIPQPAPTRPYQVPVVKRFRLKNGLQVVLAEAHDLPLVSLDLIVKTGSSANGKDKAGLASLAADMLVEGTRRRSATEIADQLAQVGAQLSTDATWDASTVSLTATSENLDPALAVWADVLLDPAFTGEDLQRVVDNLRSFVALRKEYPPVVADQVFSRALWGDGHPYAQPDTGTEATLGGLRCEDVRRFYASYYAPNNAILAVAGDVTEAQVRSKLEPLLASWKPRTIAAVHLPPVRPTRNLRIVFVNRPGSPQSSIRIGLPGIERKSPDYYRALVTNQILGGSFKRLAMNLREAKGWTYGVGSQFEARRAAGPWLVSGEFASAHTTDAVKEILKEIDRMRAGDVTGTELADTKAEIIGASPARFATPDQLAAQAARLSVYGLPDDEWNTFGAKIASVTLAQVHQTALKLFRPSSLLVVVVGDQAGSDLALSQLAPVEQRDVDGALVETDRSPPARPEPSHQATASAKSAEEHPVRLWAR